MTTLETSIAERNSSERIRGARSEVRTDKVREKQFEPYRPRGSQDIPEQIEKQYEDKGFKLYWIRILIDGEVDTNNLAEAAHKGYEPVDVSEIPDNIKRTLQISDVAGFKGLIVSKDTALFKIPRERYEEIRKYYRDLADSQIKGVHENIRQNASIHGVEVKLYDESESKVSVGEKSRQVISQEDKKSDD